MNQGDGPCILNFKDAGDGLPLILYSNDLPFSITTTRENDS
jgi:hypothetical protein